MLEVYIWGPAFGLPSIDADCLAVVLFLQSRLSVDDYVLIPSNDPLANPYGELPALQDAAVSTTEPLWHVGYLSITKYVDQLLRTELELDDQQSASLIAYTEYFYNKGRELIDLSLWVSSENYTSVTRDALHKLLQWPDSWTVPGRLRQQARSRTEHLGLSGIDLDLAAEEQAKHDMKSQGLEAQIPKKFMKPHQGVSHIFGQGSRRQQFKLAALADDFFDAVVELKTGNSWLLATSQPTTLDCIILSFVLIMDKAEVPHDWLGFSLQDRHIRLLEWCREQSTGLLGTSSKFADGSLDMSSDSLPWKKPSDLDWSGFGKSVLRNFTVVLPFIGSSYLHPTIPAVRSKHSSKRGLGKNAQKQIIRSKDVQSFRADLIASCVGLTAAASLLLWLNILRFPSTSRLPSRREFGAAGSLLGI